LAARCRREEEGSRFKGNRGENKGSGAFSLLPQRLPYHLAKQGRHVLRHGVDRGQLADVAFEEQAVVEDGVQVDQQVAWMDVVFGGRVDPVVARLAVGGGVDELAGGGVAWVGEEVERGDAATDGGAGVGPVVAGAVLGEAVQQVGLGQIGDRLLDRQDGV